MTNACAENISDQTLTSRDLRLLRSAQILVVLVATLLHGIFLSKAKPLQSANDRSRWCTIWSLTHRGTFQIDEIRQRPGWDTIDLVRVDGHYYSTKPPLLTSVVAGITWAVQRVTGLDLLSDPQRVTFYVLLIVNILPFAVSLLFWIGILELITNEPWTRFFAVVVAAFSTLVTPFLMTLNNHTVSAAATVVALYAMLKIDQAKPEARSAWSYLLCGLAVSWAAANELPAAALAGLLLILACRKSPPKTLCYFLPAAAVPLVALVATNVIATGGWKPVYADYGTDKYRFVVDGVPSYWMDPPGIDKPRDSTAVYLLHCLIGHHGIFSLTPVALLALVGWMLCFRQKNVALRALLIAGGITSIVVMAFYLSRTQNYNYGGVSCGLRWALWLTPLWLVAMVPALDLLAGCRWRRSIAVGLALVSIFSAWNPIENPWRQPWLFQWMETRGWIDYSDPAPELPRPLWTWFNSLPETDGTEPPWVEFQVLQPPLFPRFVRMTARSTPQDKNLVELEVRETSTDVAVPDRTRTLLIDRQQFTAAASPAEFVRWPDPNVKPDQQQSDMAFVRGLPRKVPYDARVYRYLKTPLRTEAIHCLQTAAHVSFASGEGDRPLNYRCDTWLSDDVPFGTIQVEYHVSQPDNAATLFHERWTIHNCWPKVKPYESPISSR